MPFAPCRPRRRPFTRPSMAKPSGRPCRLAWGAFLGTRRCTPGGSQPCPLIWEVWECSRPSAQPRPPTRPRGWMPCLSCGPAARRSRTVACKLWRVMASWLQVCRKQRTRGSSCKTTGGGIAPAGGRLAMAKRGRTGPDAANTPPTLNFAELDPTPPRAGICAGMARRRALYGTSCTCARTGPRPPSGQPPLQGGPGVGGVRWQSKSGKRSPAPPHPNRLAEPPLESVLNLASPTGPTDSL